MNYQLSSSTTVFYKYLAPATWIPIMGFASIVLLKEADFAIMWLFGSILFLWLAIQLKNVVLVERKLIIKNYRQEIVVPLADIIEVRQNYLVNPIIITLVLNNNSEFGDKIRFIPRFYLFNPFGIHPTVKLLKDKCNL